jgi:hypothetical protein
MTKFYPTRNDLDKPDKVERIFKDVYDRIYKPSEVKKPAPTIKRVDIHTGKPMTGGKGK